MDFDDSAIYFSDFGVDAVVGGVSTRGIFERAYGDALGVGGTRPALQVVESLVAPRGTSVVIGADTYTVALRQPDGTGFQWLILEAS